MNEDNLVALNPGQHAMLRFGDPSGPMPHFSEIMPSEIAAAATSCALFFSKNPETGAFYLGAMRGFKPGENLVASRSEGVEPFRSLDWQRQGFFISGDHLVIDPDNPRFQNTEGERLFDDEGQPSPALRHIQQVLMRLQKGQEESKALIAALMRHRIIEPIDISLRFDDGEKIVLQGLYTVSLDALGDMEDDAVVELFRAGHLQLAYAIAASSAQVRVLAQRRNHRLAQAAA